MAVGAVVLAGTFYWLGSRRGAPLQPPEFSAEPPVEASASQAVPVAQERVPVRAAPAQPVPAVIQTEAPAKTRAQGADATAAPAPSPLTRQAIDTLVTPGTSYASRQAAFGQLRDAGKLDFAISELEQKITENPKIPDFPATLGQAYLQKAGAINDIREQGILGMKADQTFDAALQLDPDNWDARYWKATAMSYWPTQLGKTSQVAESFLELLRIQEARTPQPEFVQTYVQLGDLYQKQGYASYAVQVWQRGLNYFPADSGLQQRLSGSNSAVSANR